MGKLELVNNTSMFVLLAIVSVTLVAGTVYAAHTADFHHGTVVLNRDNGGPGNFFLSDGFMSLTGRSDGTPSQIIDAKSSTGNQAVFRVTGDQGNAFFTIQSNGGQPTLFFKDTDMPNGREFLFRIPQPDSQSFELVDNTVDKVRMSVDKDGNWCIGDC